MNKQPLGRGLSALIPESAKRQTADRVINISIEDVTPNPYQPRIQMSNESLEELAASIKEKGVVQPILVRSMGTDKYEIIAGERRFRACKMVGLPEVPAIVREVNDTEAMAIAITENIQREDLNAVELARAYSSLMNEFNLTQEQLAQSVGKSRPSVANMMRLLQLPQEIQENILSGKISMGHARALLSLEQQNLQIELCKKIIELELSVRQTEKMVQKLLQQPKQQRIAFRSAEIEAIENKLRTMLATQVKVQQTGKKGKIEIEYYSVDDIDRIMNIIEAGLASSKKG
ncbi:MAG: ParB/RepB/Spo0J family partition protein [Candidatus Poribacteria bacterium]|nr:ParB/RepB/Spo0J family partition protein [Candidatus Poribacteria bacterium]